MKEQLKEIQETLAESICFRENFTEWNWEDLDCTGGNLSVNFLCFHHRLRVFNNLVKIELMHSKKLQILRALGNQNHKKMKQLYQRKCGNRILMMKHRNLWKEWPALLKIQMKNYLKRFAQQLKRFNGWVNHCLRISLKVNEENTFNWTVFNQTFNYTHKTGQWKLTSIKRGSWFSSLEGLHNEWEKS